MIVAGKQRRKRPTSFVVTKQEEGKDKSDKGPEEASPFNMSQRTEGSRKSRGDRGSRKRQRGRAVRPKEMQKLDSSTVEKG